MKNSVVTGLLFIIPAALLISSEKILAANPSPEPAPKTWQEAVARARELIAEGNSKRVAYDEAVRKVEAGGTDLKVLHDYLANIEKRLSKLHPDDIEAL